MWIANCIIASDDLKIRINALKYFVLCAVVSSTWDKKFLECNLTEFRGGQKCRELNNFNAITGIVAALSMSPVSRLRKTWQVGKRMIVSRY
jgi:hypothetical protein